MTKVQAKKIRQLLKVLKAVRLRCLDCSAYNPYEVKLCGIKDCPLYPYRIGVLSREGKIPHKNVQTHQKKASVKEGKEV